MGHTREEVLERVRGLIAQTLRISPEAVKEASVLTEDLGAESIDFVDVLFRIESEFGVEFWAGDAFEKFEEVLGPDVLSKDGMLTEFGAEVMRERMPEVNSARVDAGLSVSRIQALFTTTTWVRSVMELLEARPTACRACGSSDLAPFGASLMTCRSCEEELTCPTHEEVLAAWIERFSDGHPDARGRTSA